MTVRDLISQSLKKLGVLSGSEAPSANEASDAFKALNLMVDSWSTQSLLINSKVQETFAFVPNQQSYQMGLGAPDFNTIRPQKIEDAIWQNPNGVSTLDLPIKIIPQKEWAEIVVPSITSTIPQYLFVNDTYPYSTLYFWPIPQVVNNLVLWSWKPLTNFASLDTVISLPPGYAKALLYNLAVDLASDYGRTVDQTILGEALGSKADIKRMNKKTILLSQDAAITKRHRVPNWRTGG